jgi:hypothetical protein
VSAFIGNITNLPGATVIAVVAGSRISAKPASAKAPIPNDIEISFQEYIHKK